MGRAMIRALVAGLMAVIVGCSPMLKYAPVSDVTPILDYRVAPALAWTTKTVPQPLQVVAYGDPLLLLISRSGLLIRLNAENGRILRGGREPLRSTLTAQRYDSQRGRLYLAATEEQELQAFNIHSGARIWTRKKIEIAGEIMLSDSLVIGTSSKGLVTALHAESGIPVWQLQLSGRTYRGVQGGAGYAVVLTGRGRLVALDVQRTAAAAEGLPQPITVWSRQFDLAADAVITSSDDLIILADSRGTLIVLSAHDGQMRFQKQHAFPLFSAPVLSGDRLFVTGGNGEIRALDLDTGEVLWRYQGAGLVNSRTLLRPEDTVLIVPFARGELVALDMDTGELVWTHPVEPALVAIFMTPWGIAAMDGRYRINLLTFRQKASQ